MSLLSAHSYCFRGLGLEEAAAAVAAAGYGHLELWRGHAEGDTAAARRARATLERHRLRPSAYCVGGFYSGSSAERAVAARAFAFAREVGVDLVTGCLGAPAIGPIADEAARAGVRFAVENHWYQALARPRDLRLLAGTGLGLTLDTGHALMASVRPEAFVAAAGGRVWNVHLKDVHRPGWRARMPKRLRRRLRREAERSLVIGDGDLDLDALARALRAASFDGPVAVEVERAPHPRAALAASVPAVRGVVAGAAP